MWPLLELLKCYLIDMFWGANALRYLIAKFEAILACLIWPRIEPSLNPYLFGSFTHEYFV